MKKKTYKQMQNRLYREIKRRMILEQWIVFTPKFKTEERKIQTFGISKKIDRNIIPPDDDGSFAKMIKRDMVHELSDKMLENGYFSFLQREEPGGPIVDYTEIMVRVDVVEPKY